jgi:hypothetical protein
MMDSKINHNRTKERYNPRPNAGERRHHIRLMEMPCFGCGATPSGVFHHLLADSPSKKWRRDHRIGLALCDSCHRALHMAGSESKWRPDLDSVNEAETNLMVSINAGIL